MYFLNLNFDFQKQSEVEAATAGQFHGLPSQGGAAYLDENWKLHSHPPVQGSSSVHQLLDQARQL